MYAVSVAKMVKYTYPFTWRKYTYSSVNVTTRPKPCPFCNNDEVFIITDGLEVPTAWVECNYCEANGPHVAIPFNMSLYDAAIKTWNDR